MEGEPAVLESAVPGEESSVMPSHRCRLECGLPSLLTCYLEIGARMSAGPSEVR